MTKAQVPAKVITQDEVLLANCDAAALRCKEVWYDFAKALHAVRLKQAYRARGFDSFHQYVEKTFPFAIRKAQLQVRTISAFKDAGVDVEKVDKSKAYELSRVLTKHNAQELIKYQATHTHEEVANKVAHIIGSVEKHHFNFLFNDKKEFQFAEKILKCSAMKEGTDSRTVALMAIFDEWWANHAEGEDVDLEDPKRTHPMSDPVSEAVISRDKRCMNTNCGATKHLERHSVTEKHSLATPKKCTTLCHKCHVKVTDEKATVTLLDDAGKIRYEEVD